jgi:hypothetical protein
MFFYQSIPTARDQFVIFVRIPQSINTIVTVSSEFIDWIEILFVYATHTHIGVFGTSG